MWLHFMSGYHPEGDGQMEQVNQVLEQYLQVYTNYQQDDWAELLPLTEFTYNNATNATMGVAPFFANKGYHPELTTDLTVVTTSTEAEQFIANLSDLQDKLKENIARTQERYQRNANCNRAEPPNMKLRAQVYTKPNNFTMRSPPKQHSPK